MATSRARAWLVLELLFPLFTPSVPDQVQSLVKSLVGSEVLLPCPCPPLAPPMVPHVQWSLEDSGPVLEQRGQQIWTREELSGRAQVPESGPETGNCSLILRDLQISDSGSYHGYLIQDPDQTRTRTRTRTGVLICSVKLLVFDHSSVQYKSPGEDLVLDLHSPQAMSLVFQSSNSTEWRSLWQRGAPTASPRVEKVPLKLQLRLSSLADSDEGVYKVLDQNGLSMSSTWLHLDQDREGAAPKFSQEAERLFRASSVRLTSCLFMVTVALSSSLL